jgi:membrane-associated phospholipid phosphatase
MSAVAEPTNDMVQADGENVAPVGDKLAAVVEAGHGSSRWARALREVGAIDRATYEAVAHTASPTLDRPIRMLSQAADHSRLWLAVAGAVAVAGGVRGRRAAAEGLVAVGVTSAVVNVGFKHVFRRGRPDRGGTGMFNERHSEMPTSTSFPSGHSASAFAFAHGVGRHLPFAALPLRMLAGAVAYSRVHVGVHYPGDVVIGSILGAGSAAIVGATFDHLASRTA